MNRNKSFIGMCLRRLFGEGKIITLIDKRPILTVGTYLTLNYLFQTPHMITLMVIDMLELL